jgi:hypothetical protein
VGGQKERVGGGEYELTLKPIKLLLKGGRNIRKSNREGKFDQNTLYAYMTYHNETPLYN